MSVIRTTPTRKTIFCFLFIAPSPHTVQETLPSDTCGLRNLAVLDETSRVQYKTISTCQFQSTRPIVEKQGYFAQIVVYNDNLS